MGERLATGTTLTNPGLLLGLTLSCDLPGLAGLVQVSSRIASPSMSDARLVDCVLAAPPRINESRV